MRVRTHNGGVDQASNLWEYLQGPPLQILIIVLLAVAIRWISVAVLNRIIKRMAAQGRRERLGETRRAERTQELSEVLMSQRRQQRAEAIGALLRSVITATVLIIALLVHYAVLSNTSWFPAYWQGAAKPAATAAVPAATESTIVASR